MYVTKFGRSRSNCSGVARSSKHSGDAEPQPLRWGVVTLRKFFSHPSYRANFAHSAYNWTSVINGYVPKILPLASHLSKSLEVIETDPDRPATYDFLLVMEVGSASQSRSLNMINNLAGCSVTASPHRTLNTCKGVICCGLPQHYECCW